MKIKKVLRGKVTSHHRSVTTDENGQEIKEASFLTIEGLKEGPLGRYSPILTLDGLYPVGSEFILTLEET